MCDAGICVQHLNTTLNLKHNKVNEKDLLDPNLLRTDYYY